METQSTSCCAHGQCQPAQSSALQIIEVEGKRAITAFIDLPWAIYKNDAHWIPPLKMAVKDLLAPKHPVYETCEVKLFLAYKNGKCCGRIMGVVNHHHNQFHNEKAAQFGFFEAINDQEVANALLKKVEDWSINQGMEIVRGPFNPSSNYECGLLVEGFHDDPQIMMTYNLPYFQTLLEEAAYKKSMDLLAYQFDMSFVMPEKISKISKKVEESANITYRIINMKNWTSEVALMREIYNAAWEKNWGFVPMTEKEFAHTAKDLKTVIDPNLVLFVYVKNEPAGFIVGLPDYNQIFKTIPTGKLFPTGLFKLLTGKKKINRFRVLTMGVKEKFRNLGLASLMYVKAYENARKTYRECEMSWILESNFNMNRPLQLMGATPYKRYRIFEKVLRMH